jgi:Zn-finger nucleic acid-binding protein
MHAETLHCPNCGAASLTEASRCAFCESRLATVACPSCFGMMFIGSKHCPQCGAAAVAPETASVEARPCPRCEIEMNSIVIGATPLSECSRCEGLWVDVRSFEKICADREEQSVMLGVASQAPTQAVRETSKVKYVPCPDCSQLMNRMNFARCSGVIVDTCKGHGIWFDRDELSRIVEFIRGGGLEASREREKAEIREDRRRLLEQQAAAETRVSKHFGRALDDDRRIPAVAAARGLLKFLLDK